jgi:hypothetical protein
MLLRLITILGAAGFLLTACAGNDPRNLVCARMAQPGGLRWGYYPGYGCGPVPPAEINFS